MPLYLQILVSILVCLAIILCVYLIISSRRRRIVAKKLDYLVEDITYKLEILSPTIDSIAKLGKFIDIFDNILKEKTQNLVKYTSNNEETLYKLAREVKEVWNKTKKQVNEKQEVKQLTKSGKKHAKKI